MAVNPSFISPLKAEIVDVKGTFSAGYQKGDTFSISCYDSGGLLPDTDMRWGNTPPLPVLLSLFTSSIMNMRDFRTPDVPSRITIFLYKKK